VAAGCEYTTVATAGVATCRLRLVTVGGGGGGAGWEMGLGREGKRSAAEVTEDLKAAAERWSDMVARSGGVTRGSVV